MKVQLPAWLHFACISLPGPSYGDSAVDLGPEDHTPAVPAIFSQFTISYYSNDLPGAIITNNKMSVL